MTQEDRELAAAKAVVDACRPMSARARLEFLAEIILAVSHLGRRKKQRSRKG